MEFDGIFRIFQNGIEGWPKPILDSNNIGFLPTKNYTENFLDFWDLKLQETL